MKRNVMEKKYVVYEHVSKDGKRYIGITSQILRKRWRNGEGYKNNIHFYHAIQKYGWNTFEHNILYENVSEDEAKAYEMLLIERYNTRDPKFGYNVTRGGDTRKPCSDETKAKLSERLRGKTKSEETKKKMSEAAKRRPKRKMTDEQRKRLSESLKGNKRALGSRSNSKMVAMCDDEKNVIKYFLDSKEASLLVKCDKSGINRACKENQTSTDLNTTKYGGKYAGYRWFYVNKDGNIIDNVVHETKINKRNTPLIQYDLEGKKIQEFEKLSYAAKQYGIPSHRLSFALKNKNKVCYHGYVWERKIPLLEG